MTAQSEAKRADATADETAIRTVNGGFAAIDDARFVRIDNVDQMAPFLMSIASDSDVWLFVGSNGPFTAGRRSPDTALFPYQTVDKILRHPATSGARTSLLVTRPSGTALWEPWLDAGGSHRISRNLYKRIDGTEVVFEEVNHDLGVRFRWSLSASEPFGLVRRAELQEIAGKPAQIRYLDGFHQVIPPGVDQDTYARLSYLAAAYMRHERLPEGSLAVYALNAAISDRAEPSESLAVAGVWSTGHRNPTILLSDRQLATFRLGGDVHPEGAVRGEIGAYLVVDDVELGAGARHDWTIVGDTRLDHASIVDLKAQLSRPGDAARAVEASLDANRAGVRRRVAAADGIQHTADEAATVNQFSNVLFNIMRGGSFDDGYRIPDGDFRTYLREQNRAVLERHVEWLDRLPVGLTLAELKGSARDQQDPQLDRLVGSYLPLTFGRRHGDPSRPWNRFSINIRDGAGRPVYGYQGNWRDIFQNWEALGRSYPAYLGHFVNVFLNASTADGYNPYRITRSGLDWEVEDPLDPWSHIGYWGDHQIVYLLRLLEALEDHEPGALVRSLDERAYAYASVPYRIADIASVLADPRVTIHFDRALHDDLIDASGRLGADGKLLRDAAGDVRLVTLAEKLLVPVLVKLTNLVPDGGIWLNTQRPEWNDANNALAGWGLSVVTLSAIRRYLTFVGKILTRDTVIRLSPPVTRLLISVTEILEGIRGPIDDVERYRILVALGGAGDEHRRAAYSGDLGDPLEVSTASVHALISAAVPLIERTLRASRRNDALYHSYNLLRIEGDRASIHHLGPMLEGQVTILDSGLLGDDEAVELLRALRASDMYRPDQHSYLLYPDRILTPYLERNTLSEAPPITDPSVFVADRSGAWHFHADLGTASDVEHALDRLEVEPTIRQAVLELWRSTFAHDEFTGRSGTFFMFEGLGSVYWHMVAKLLLAVQGCHRRSSGPDAERALAGHYHDIRDGLGFRRTAQSYGAFPTDPYSHTPRHHGAQQPGMTGQVKEQVLSRAGELGIEVVDGHLRFRPQLVDRSEFDDSPFSFHWLDVGGSEQTYLAPADSLAFTYCQVPVIYTLGREPSIELERADGRTEVVSGLQLDRVASSALFGRAGIYRRLAVTLPEGMPRSV